MKKSIKTASRSGSLAEAYFRYLETAVKGADGVTKQPASTNFVSRLREVHAREKGRQGLSAQLNDAFTAGRLYVWSDLHLGHKALEKLRGRSASETDAVMLSNALATVTEKDILIFGGDITVMTDIRTTNEWLRQIPAAKVLVLGNHDCDKHAHSLLKLAVDDVVSCLELDGIFVSHFPVPERLLDTARPGEGIVNLHGHVHAHKLSTDEFGSGARHMNMSVECINYAPVLAGSFD